MLDALRDMLGPGGVLEGAGAAPYGLDWAGVDQGTPLAVLRPRSTEQVSAILRAANEAGIPVVPMGGNTGLTQATAAQGAWVLSLERMNKVLEVNAQGRIAIVEAGAILSTIHDAAEAKGLIFPLFFGARGSARIGGALSTNAGGSNVLRYGNTRDLCLGLEVVLPSGEVANLMSALHKDNSGYNLKHLMIGAEGTLGVITKAVLKLFPRPLSYATAMVGMDNVEDALVLLRALQEATGGAVEAFEYMPAAYMEAHARFAPDARPPFERVYPVNILVELGSAAPRDAAPGAEGGTALTEVLEGILADFLGAGRVHDALIAQTESQRTELWRRREDLSDLSLMRSPVVHNDVAVPLHQMGALLARIRALLAEHDADAVDFSVAHLGDGNLHFAIWPGSDHAKVHQTIYRAVEEAVIALGGSFSAEHGIGKEKRGSMARYKDPAALAAMRAIKSALDPKEILNPGKVLPD